MIIRIATPTEYPAIAELTVDAYRADGQLVEASPYETELRDVAGRAGRNDILVAVGEPDGRILGTVTFVRPGSELIELSRPGEAEFRMLAVDPAAQGRGVGTALVRACVDRATRRGASAVVICTRDIAVGARRMYERLGFVRAPDLDWSPMPGINLIALRLGLSDPVGVSR